MSAVVNPFRIFANGVENESSASALSPWNSPPHISSLLIKPASALCNLDCQYCFYLDRSTDPYQQDTDRTMSRGTLRTLVESYLAYSYPEAAFAFQGGEPTLAGLDFFQELIRLQKQFARRGQIVSNSIQTNGTLLTSEWCQLLRDYSFLVGISLDGPEDIHDLYRVNKAQHGTWASVSNGIELLQRERVEFNVLCVVSQANVRDAARLYSYFRSLQVEHLQFIPLVEFTADGRPEAFAITGEEYGKFLCELFQLWWPDRRTVRIRHFDNIAEALAGMRPGTCTMHDSCHSYAVVEHNGDVYPCDFFVQQRWRLGNLNVDSWTEIARRGQRREFAKHKQIRHPECDRCRFRSLCHGGCPSNRQSRGGRFEDLDPLCAGYKMIFEQSIAPLTQDLRDLGVLPLRLMLN